MIGYSGIYSPNNKKNQESITIPFTNLVVYFSIIMVDYFWVIIYISIFSKQRK